MIAVKASPTADTRTCDVSLVSKLQLFQSSAQHIQDVRNALYFFRTLLQVNADLHDADKLTDIDGFYRDFQTKFETTEWWDNHRKITRHHLNYEDGVPSDVNLLDVLEYIADCVMAGMARQGSVYPLPFDRALMEKAFENTVALLVANVVVEPR